MTTPPAWLTEATYFGVLASIAAYALGVWLRRSPSGCTGQYLK